MRRIICRIRSEYCPVRVGYVCGVQSPADLKKIMAAFNASDCGNVVIDAAPHRGKLLANLVKRLEVGDTLVVWDGTPALGLPDMEGLKGQLQRRGILFEAVQPVPGDRRRLSSIFGQAARHARRLIGAQPNLGDAVAQR